MLEMFGMLVCMLDTSEEKHSFTVLYTEMRRKCFHRAYYYTKNSEMAWDVVHDAFAHAIKQKEYFFSKPCNERNSLIVIITRNLAINLMKSAAESRKSSFDDENMPNKFDIYDTVEQADGYNQILVHVSTLPEKYKDIFALRYVHEKSNKEIASILKISDATVRTRLSRARQMLQTMLKEGARNG
jgi:RNA polymerase sigma-70 factor (ECF subfamily)